MYAPTAILLMRYMTTKRIKNNQPKKWYLLPKIQSTSAPTVFNRGPVIICNTQHSGPGPLASHCSVLLHAGRRCWKGAARGSPAVPHPQPPTLVECRKRADVHGRTEESLALARQHARRRVDGIASPVHRSRCQWQRCLATFVAGLAPSPQSPRLRSVVPRIQGRTPRQR